MNALKEAYDSSGSEGKGGASDHEDEDRAGNCWARADGLPRAAGKRRRLIEPEILPFSLPALPVALVSNQYVGPPEFVHVGSDGGSHQGQGPRQPSAASSAGRYVSKRERAAAAAAAASAAASVADASPSKSAAPVLPAPGLKDILNAAVPAYIAKKLQNIVPEAENYNRLPRRQICSLRGHTKGVNAVRWSPTHVSLLASAGMDHMSFIWNAWNDSKQQMVRKLSSHAAPVKDIQWSVDGRSIVSCGFEKTCRLTDVEMGSDIKVFLDDQIVNVVKFHPLEHSVFLSGGSKGALKLWDTRTGNSVREYSKGLGPIMDFDFSFDGKRFVSTSDMAKRHTSDKAIVVWDYSSQVALSNQVYLEAYTCPCVRYHPFQETFIAQSNGNYIAIFSGRPPFKMDKYKRFESHQVSAYQIRCNFSPCGGFVLTGSADGCVYIYNFRTSKVLKKLETHRDVCTDVSYHPVLPSVMASSSWDGLINIYE